MKEIKLNHEMFPSVEAEFKRLVKWTDEHKDYQKIKVDTSMMESLLEFGLNAINDIEVYGKQVEEMQKTLVEIANMRPSICTWSDEEYYENFSKCEEIAQQTIQSLKGDKP